MKFKSPGAILAMAASIASFLPLSLFAGTLYPLTYTDNGSSITISDCVYSTSGEIVIPATIDGKPVTVIGDSAFESTPLLKGVTIPSSVTRIGKNAFSNCQSLRRVNIPPDVTAIDDGTFYHCLNLASITIPTGVTRIGNYAFDSCSKLVDVLFPITVTEIGSHAFSGCQIVSLVIPAHVKTVGGYAFSSCKIQTLKIDSSGTIIGAGVFQYCRQLTDVVLASDVKEISNFMFSGCYSLEKVKFPSTVRRIGISAFGGTGLKSIDLDSSLVRIEENAFRGCSGLSMVTIPESVREIGPGAFGNCRNLVSALYLGDAPVMGKSVFLNSHVDLRIYFEEGTHGYTIPTWHGYRSSLPKAEIEVRANDGTVLLNAANQCRFGSALVATEGATRRFTVRNVGARKLTGLSAKVHLGNASDFTLKMAPKSSLAPGKIAFLDITFLPKKSGKRLSQLQIISSDANENPFEIHLLGTGLELIK